MANYMDFKEKFGVAVEVLATSPASLRNRLEQATVSFVPMFAEMESGGLTEGLQQKMRALLTTLTRVKDPSGQRGALAATLDGMSEAELSSAAKSVWEMYRRFADLHANPDM